jgi:NAD(P)H-dependent glutamate synthase small subunit
MAKSTGFLEHKRENPAKRQVSERIRDFREFETLLPVKKLQNQASRCMDCGVPSCHAFGCPLVNRIPDFNDMVYRGQWKLALDLLHETNNFPEITGRICPAPCEASCTLSINQESVTIRHIELAIAEQGWALGLIKPEPCLVRTGKRVAVLGSGPAGLAAAQELARTGHDVVVFEKQDKPGGLLRYGIPDFKLEKRFIDRRLEQLRGEGVQFETGVIAGTDISVQYIRHHFDAVLIAAGAAVPRTLNLPGQKLQGVHFAMEYLKQQNRLNAGNTVPTEERIEAGGKDVVVIGGGDTGSDCVGTARRQGALSITQIELLPEPPGERRPENPWPTWPSVMRTSSSQEEGCERMWSVMTKEMAGVGGKVKALKCVKLEWTSPDRFREISGSDFELKADLVLMALGFLHVEHGPIIKDFGIHVDKKGNIAADGNAMTSAPGVFSAGDSVLGASLVVKAIDQGRKAAKGIDRYLMQK